MKVARWVPRRGSGSNAVPLSNLIEQDAQKLISWMAANNIRETNIGNLRRTSPIRDTKRRDQAIELLKSHHYLHTSNISNRTVAVYLNPDI